jgi:methyl-accepting chemotaxis protein I, serine sensor receptor
MLTRQRRVERGQSKIMRSLKLLLACQLLVALLSALVLATTAVVSQQRLGETAGRALVAKDVTADVLPPPMYLIELRLVLAQGLDGTLPATSVRDEVVRLVREYQDRVAYWGSNPPFGLERELLGAQHAAAEEFIAAAQSQVVAPLLANNRAAAATALPDVHRLYLAHRPAWMPRSSQPPRSPPTRRRDSSRRRPRRWWWRCPYSAVPRHC